MITEIGEGAYDSYLFATARRNRLSVISVADGSVAQVNGVQKGDMIHSLDGKRIYGLRDLQQIQSKESYDDLIEMRVIRGEQNISFFVSRGSFGLRLANIRVNPALVEN